MSDKMFTWVALSMFIPAVIGLGYVVYDNVTGSSSWPSRWERCRDALPDVKVISAESVDDQILCRTLAAGADAEVWVWLDGDGVVLK